jgi:hypothetical protein
MLMHYYYARIRLFEIGYHLVPVLGDIATAMQPIDVLNNCLSATVSLNELCQSIPASEFYTLPLFIYGQSFHALVTATRLSLFEGVGWDKHLARKQINIASIISESARRLKEASDSYGPSKDEGVLYNINAKLDRLKQTYEARLALELESEQITMPEGTDYNEMLSMEGLDYWDDNFWTSLQLNWNSPNQ